MPQPCPRPASSARTLGPVARSRLTDEVATRLVASIVEGKFKLGERLPAERDLARFLHVGRPTLREAIVTLRGLVRQADSPEAEAVVVTCTNLGTGRLVDELEAESGKPVFDSLLAMWHPLRLLGWDRPMPRWGRVLGDGR